MVQTKKTAPKVKIPTPVSTNNNIIATQNATTEAINAPQAATLKAITPPMSGNKICQPTIKISIKIKVKSKIFFMTFPRLTLLTDRLDTRVSVGRSPGLNYPP